MANLRLKIVSQTKEIYEGEVSQLKLPSTSGDIVILPEHVNLITTLSTGVIRVSETSGVIQNFIISAGLVNVKNNEITILVDEAVLPEDLVKEEIERALEDAQKSIEQDIDPAEMVQLEKQLRFEMFKKKFMGDEDLR